MRVTHSSFVSCWAVLAVTSCYSPNFESATATSATEETSGGSSTTSQTSQTSQTLSTTENETASESEASASGDVADSSSGDAQTDDSSSGVAAESSTGRPADPFCGDLNIDPGEDCDNGDANALDAECRPDCTLAECGDGDIWAGVEACDDGEDDNILQVGACAPDCSRVIEEKVLRLGDSVGGGDLGANPIAFVDSHCAPTERAMFAFPGLREAALNSFDTSGSIDWVLQPYTAYVRENGLLLWITDDVPLLGVRDGGQLSLLNSIVNECPKGNICFEGRAITGLGAGWLTSTTEDCQGWTSESTNDDVRRGYASSSITFLYDPDYTTNCDLNPLNTQVYCVEQ